MYFYSENEIRSSRPFVVDNFDATQMYATHFYNACVLKFLVQHETIHANKMQAIRELEIAERKMKFWRQQYNYNQDESIRLCDAIKKKMKK